WPISDKATYIYKIAKESSSSHKYTHDNEDTLTEPTIQEDNSAQQLFISHSYQEPILK
ncbi:3133_t:CDS:1, partial [Scutellospora calospora]